MSQLFHMIGIQNELIITGIEIAIGLVALGGFYITSKR